MATPQISFIVPVRNDAERLRRCLASIVNVSQGTNVEIVVADNGSTDHSAAVAREAHATVLVLPGLSVAQLRNAAARSASAPLLAFVDADHELHHGWTQAALHLMADPTVWVAGAEYHGQPEGSWVQRLYDRFRDHRPEPRPVSWLPSGNIVVRRSAFDEVRGFDEGLESCEDVDFCRKIRQHGGRLISAGALGSTHFGDPRNLRALFFSELWRGRDNLRVSLREPLTLRSAPSIVIPLVNLVLGAAGVASLLTFSARGTLVAGVCALVFLLLTTLRSLRLISRIPAGTGRVAESIGALPVAATYDVARALALILRVGHALRRKS